MKRKAINIFAILVCIIAFTCIGKAFPTDRLKVEIPFDFIIKKKKFQAGKYSIERLDAANPDLFVLKNDKGEIKTIFGVRPINGEETVEKSHLNFKRSNNDHLLREIWTVGNKYGLRVISDDGK